MKYSIAFAKSVKGHMRFLNARDCAIVFDGIDRHLADDPLTETRNRKLLRPNPLAPWELRLGYLRVFYDVGVEDPTVVRVLAVGTKKGDKLCIGGKEIVL